jgi:tetratricopeptide (TPR) repeat protein
MKTPHFLLIVALAVTALLLAIPAQAGSLDDANRAFAGGHFDASTQGYLSIQAQNGYSAPVLFDLGNSYFKEGNFAQAILAYKRAQWLSPNDPDIAANLQLAQKQAGLPLSDSGPIAPYVHALNATSWAWMAGGAWTLLCVMILMRSLRPKHLTAFSLLAAGSSCLLVIAATAVVFELSDFHQAIVTDKNATALISPFPAAQTVFAVAPGETVWVQKKYHDFLFVKNAAGQTGWISKPQVTEVVPSDATSRG